MILDKEIVRTLFPMPSYRKYQKETIDRIIDEFNTGVKCILLDAPTGFGKSGVNVNIGRATTEKAFYITPQLALIDQLRKDKNVGRYLVDIKGRQNYSCVKDPVSTCDIGLCKRVKDCNCQKQLECRYWQQKIKALSSQIALMSFSYFILEGQIETEFSFGRRELTICDEAHSLDRHIVNHVSLTVSPYSIPFETYQKVYNYVGKVEDMTDAVNVVSMAKDFAQTEIDSADTVKQMTLTGGTMSLNQATNVKRLQDFVGNAERFMNCMKDTEWIWQVNWCSYKQKKYPKLWLQPLYARPFMRDMFWCRSDYFIISTATILNVPIYIKETGLDTFLEPDQIIHLSIPSTFPPENRPIIDSMVGKMTHKELAETFKIAIETLERIFEIEKDVNIAVHCHSYKMSIEILNNLSSKYKERIICHTSEDRQERLNEWMSSKGKIFLAVSLEEGQDWAGDICEAQVLFKVPYLDISDKRVARRLEKYDWAWYRNEALKTIVQSYGRAVRSDTDKARYYVIDSCFIDVLKRCKKDIPRWFKDALPSHMKELLK